MSKLVGPSWLFNPDNTVGGMGRSTGCSLPWSSGPQINLDGIHVVICPVCVIFVVNDRGLTDPEFGIGIAKGRDFVGNPQHLLNCPWADEIISQSVQ